MEKNTQKVLQYIKSLLDDSSIVPTIPEELMEIQGMEGIDLTIRNLRQAIRAIGAGELSGQFNGKGYLMGTTKSLQAALKNLIWQTKAISSGDFSQKVIFLGEFSEAFNNMANQLEKNINEVKEAKALLELVFEMIPDATMIVSYEGLKVYNCNQAFEKITGHLKNDLYGKSLRDLTFFKDVHQEKEFLEAAINAESFHNLSLELDLNMNNGFQGLISSAIIYIEQERYILSVIKDVTEFKRLERKLIESEAIHRMLADNANDVIWTMDLTGKFTYISPSVEKLRGYTVEEVFAQSPEELLTPESLVYLHQGLEDAMYHVSNNLPFKVFRGDMEQPCKDGTTVWTDLTVSGIYDQDNQFLGMLGVSRDITERKKMEEEIIRLTEIDRLTQLYNRLKLDNVIKSEIERSNRSNSPCSLIMLDIDDFKRVNDSYGHIVGDTVLIEVAQIIESTIRVIDIAGRWGGEEFMIVLPETDMNGGYTLAEKLRENIYKHQFSKVGNLSGSFGVSQFEIGINETELVFRADAAMYTAKKAGKNRVFTYKDYNNRSKGM